MKHFLIPLLLIVALTGKAQDIPKEPQKEFPFRTVHCFVALCDNENQGIVPVPAKIGNGQDPIYNLYWGAGYGVKNYFRRKDPSWTMLKVWNPKEAYILERALFKHKTKDIYVLADAYDGAFMKMAMSDFLEAARGNGQLTIEHNDATIPFGGPEEFVTFNGHNGLMDVSLENSYQGPSNNKRQAMVMACYSKSYFKPYLKSCGIASPVWSTHLMSAEGYTTAWAVNAWVKDPKNSKSQAEQAAQAYNTYQKCGINGARRLIVNGY